jgi:hypothetical protein
MLIGSVGYQGPGENCAGPLFEMRRYVKLCQREFEHITRDTSLGTEPNVPNLGQTRVNLPTAQVPLVPVLYLPLVPRNSRPPVQQYVSTLSRLRSKRHRETNQRLISHPAYSPPPAAPDPHASIHHPRLPRPRLTPPTTTTTPKCDAPRPTSRQEKGIRGSRRAGTRGRALPTEARWPRG